MQRTSLWVVLLLMSTSTAISQKLQMEEVEFPISKTAQKKGMYVSTGWSDSGTLNTFIAYDLKGDILGFDVISVDKSGKLAGTASETASADTQKKYGITIPDPETVQNPAQGKSILRLVTSNGVLGKLKVEEGYFEPKYATSSETSGNWITYTKVLRGFKFVGEKSVDSDTRLNVYAAFSTPENSVEQTYTIIEGYIPNTVGYLFENGEISFLGKNAQFDKNSPNAQNVVMTGKFDGKTRTFKNMQEHVLEYNLHDVTSGFTADGNRAVLLSTVNAPSTISAHKKWQSQGIPYMTYMSFDTEGNVKENVTFKSKSVRGNFGLFGHANANYVLGSINSDHDGYHRADVGKVSDFQVVKLVNGQVEKQEVFTLDQLEAMSATADGKSAKLKSKDIVFSWYESLSNGDFLAFADGPGENLIFQIGADAQLKKVYVLDRVPGKELYRFGVQTQQSGDDLFVLYREQSPVLSLGVSRSVSRGSGYAKNINFSRVDELMTYGSLYKLNPSAMTISEPVNFTSDVILGDTPMFSGDAGLMLPLRDSKGGYKMALVK